MHLINLFNIYLKYRIYLIKYKKVRIIALYKFIKLNYIQITIYKLIILLNIINKLLKTIIITCLNNLTKLNKLFLYI